MVITLAMQDVLFIFLGGLTIKKHVQFIALFAIFGLVFGAFSNCSLIQNGEKDREFSKAGMTITLTDAFTEKEWVSLTACYESRESMVSALKEEFSLFEAAGLSTDMALTEYADIVISSNSIYANIEEKDGLICFQYEKQVTGRNVTYFATVFRGTDAYWLIQFACESNKYDSLADQFAKWAKTVKVS